jgi:hypothetical protein
MSKIRRINLYGGPCCGKSTLMTWLFSELKSRQFEIEMAPEWIKTWTFEKKEPQGFDQVYIYGNSMQQEELPLRSGTDLVITDAPLLLNNYYGTARKIPGIEHLVAMTKVFEEKYPSLNIFLERADFGFSDVARYHDEEQSKQIDDEMWDFLNYEFISGGIINFLSFRVNKKEYILKYILQQLKGEKNVTNNN